MRFSALAALPAALLLFTACGSQGTTPALASNGFAKHTAARAAAPPEAPPAASPSYLRFSSPDAAPQTVTITISNPPITATSADPYIASVSYEHGHTVHTGSDGDDRYVTLTVTPAAFGYTTITVTDKHTGSISIPVQVGGGHGFE